MKRVPSPGRTALVTGAFGFLGRHVARAAAAAGYEVLGLGHGDWSRAEWRGWGLADWRGVDITADTLAAHGGEPDVVFHCAGSGAVGFSLIHPRQDFDRSVTATADVLEYLRLTRRDARFVLPSSAGVYGAAARLPIAVDAPPAPVSPYGVHKLAAELTVRSYGRYFGLPVAIVRLFSVYGAGLRKQLLWDACRRLSTGDAEFGGTGGEQRDWIHVEDAARLLLRAAEVASPDAPTANGAAGCGVPVRQVVERIAGRLGGARASFSGITRPGDPQHYVADIAEAQAWGWTPEHALEPGIDGYVDWFLTERA